MVTLRTRGLVTVSKIVNDNDFETAKSRTDGLMSRVETV